MSKLISILIPVYNNEEFLKFSLKSAVQQTYKNIEILIINDGSKNLNKIKEIINSFKDYRINLYSFNKNQGISNALNYGIKKSKGIDNILKHIKNTTIIKNNYIKNKLVNFITKK